MTTGVSVETRELWRQRGIDILDVPLASYLEELGARVSEAAR